MTATPIDWEHVARASSALEVYLLGKVDFASLLGLQTRLADQISQRGDTHGILLVCEHPPSISIGREGSFADVLVEREELIAREMDIRWLNRGGGAWVHAPGQVAVYALLPLDRLKLGLVEYLRRLEQSVIAMAADLDVVAERSEAAPGATCRCGQFAFVGASVRDWVSRGGLCVNVSLPQEALDLVRWTNADVRITSLAAQRTRPTAMGSVRESIIRHLAESMGYDDYHLFTGHPLLRRTTRKVYVYS